MAAWSLTIAGPVSTASPATRARWRLSDPDRGPTPAREVDFFLEYDRGTEPLDRLAAKLAGYQELADATQIATRCRHRP